MNTYYYNNNYSGQEGTYIVEDLWGVISTGDVDPRTATPAEVAAAGYYLLGDLDVTQYDGIYQTATDNFTIDGTNATHQLDINYIDLADAKVHATQSLKDYVYNLLRTSDWMIIRKYETGEEPDAEWSTYRGDLRTSITTKKAAIDACTTTEEVVNYVYGSEYNTWPTAPNTY